MSVNNYRIKIVRDNQEFEVEGDKEFVLEMIEKFETFSDKQTLQSYGNEFKEGEKPISKTVSTKPVSVGEFIRLLGFKKHTDIVLSFGYYLEIYGDLKEFSPADINNCYYEAKMESSNTSQMIIYNIKKGFFMPTRGENKNYTLTQTGIDYIKENLKH
ncbi:MAG: hypothetical protein A2068_09455 [Ignavibacteria bacterium GWB2_35_6b]|nr:MAG: hypothetical protein A2068_09455 [Ignavibacteria bacterium GWB2_35_6b]